MAAPSASVLLGPGYIPPIQERWGLIAAEDLPPVPQAQACFDRAVAEELIRSFDRLPTAGLPHLSSSLERYSLLRRLLRSPCSLDADSI
jgi:hypothetical protein